MYGMWEYLIEFVFSFGCLLLGDVSTREVLIFLPQKVKRFIDRKPSVQYDTIVEKIARLNTSSCQKRQKTFANAAEARKEFVLRF